MPVSTVQMRVHKYIPDRLYGFTIGTDGKQAFFHLGSFEPGDPVEIPKGCGHCSNTGCTWVQMPSPPILGELVEVEVDFDQSEDKAPRANRVRRLNESKACYGVVETFDPFRGFGFARDQNGISYHLHKSEILHGRIPMKGDKVTFYAGVRRNRPRACHVMVCP